MIGVKAMPGSQIGLIFNKSGTRGFDLTTL